MSRLPVPCWNDGREAAAAGHAQAHRVRGIFSSRREEEKFSGLPPINSDEVLDAHRFFTNLGSDWMAMLPKKSR